MLAQQDYRHVPVMAERCLELLSPALTVNDEAGNGALYIDVTLGLGGHTQLFLDTFPGIKVIGIDRDLQALSRAQARLALYKDRFFSFHTRFDQIAQAVEASPWRDDYDSIAILGDFGVSSYQLDSSERGFSYHHSGPLDMRMNPAEGMSCADFLAQASRGEIARVLRDYGEEKFAHSIAANIVKEREKTPLVETQQLVDIIYRSIPAASRRKGGHPAKRTFQALRIAVNAELESITLFLPQAFSLLPVRGRLACMSFQSLEDKIVKRFFHDMTESKTPAGLPIELPDKQPQARYVTRGSEKASSEESAQNSRATSVRLRAVEKISITPTTFLHQEGLDSSQSRRQHFSSISTRKVSE